MRVIEDARSAGWNVYSNGPESIRVLREKTCKSYGLIFWEDGTATRADVRLDLAKAIRTEKAMRKALNLS
mgnify:CR=1 FL=1